MHIWLKRAFNFGGGNALMLASFVMIGAAMLSLVLEMSSSAEPWRFYASFGLLIMILGLNIVFANIDDIAPERRTRNYALYFIFSALCLLGLFVVARQAASFYLIFMFTAQAFVVMPFRWALIYTLSFFAAIVGVTMWLSDKVDLYSLMLSLLLGNIFTATFGVTAVRYAEQTTRATQLLQQLQAANQELEQAREREKDLAVAQERVRLARDIHDGLGHHLTVLGVQLQAAAKLLDRDSVRARAALELCQQEANAALNEIRHSVATMRHSPLAGRTIAEALQKLANDVAERMTMQIELHMDDALWQTTAATDDTLYRTAQEGLTNAHKHGKASHAEIELRYHTDHVCLQVRDNGTIADSGGVAGFGLAGLRERAEQLGGTCRAEATPDGFVLEICLPRENKEQRA